MDLNLEPTPENPAQKRKIAMIVALVSALLILVPLFTHAWLRAPAPIDAGFGLWSLEICQEGACATQGNKAIIDEYNRNAREAKQYGMNEEEKSPVFWLMGYATLLFAGLGAVSLIVAAVTLGQGKLMMRPFAPTSTAMMFLFLSLITACVFVATNPSRGDFTIQLGVGWAFWVFGVGNVGGIAAVPMMLKFKPVEPDHFSV